ncbi:NERD domain-containing protein [Beggiatoa alba]|nr:NERD domain-containing protein [Beggiatoa alba]
MRSIPIETLFYVLEGALALLVLGVGFFIWKQMHKGRHQRHAQKVIESLGIKYLHNAVFPDGIDGLVFIDYLLLVKGGFVVLDMEHSEGHLFGGESVDQWSQVLNNKTYKFNNPLYANQQKCQAVIWNIKQHTKTSTDADGQHPSLVHGWVTFTHAGNFPKGIPARVSMIDELKQNLGELISADQPVNSELHETWDALYTIALNTRAENAP